ncbi:MAG: AtpZ/AtpI family protein [Planctomycetaceae bacterium]|nr:AtpZ/AtpI family protein [Planctomycetaceae bacterium]
MLSISGRSGKSRASQIAQAYRAANEVISGAVALVICVGCGYAADARFGCRPVLTVCGACLGFATWGLSLRQLLLRIDRESKEQKKLQAENRETSEL